MFRASAFVRVARVVVACFELKRAVTRSKPMFFFAAVLGETCEVAGRLKIKSIILLSVSV